MGRRGFGRTLLADLIAQIIPETDTEFLALAIFAGMRPEITDMLGAPRHRAGVLALTARILANGDPS
ncbi:hypothetical protein [Nocardia grenadensis]